MRERKVNVTSCLAPEHLPLGPAGSSSAEIAENLLKANGLTVADVRGERVPYPETVERLAKGDFDAAFMIQIPGSDFVTQAARDGSVFGVGTTATIGLPVAED